MSRGDLADGALELGKVSFIHVPVMRSDGETFSLDERAHNASEFFPKVFFRCIKYWQKLRCLLSPQSAPSGDIKSVAASVNDAVDADALANVFELSAA